MVLRNRLPPLLRRNGLATKNSLCSLRLPPYIYSPVRFIPAIGVMSGAHYRTLLMFFTSPTRSQCTPKNFAFSGTPPQLVGAPNCDTRALNLNCKDSPERGTIAELAALGGLVGERGRH